LSYNWISSWEKRYNNNYRGSLLPFPIAKIGGEHLAQASVNLTATLSHYRSQLIALKRRITSVF
jgi:hypothetical protein